jgi:hypothetical protein
VIVFVLDLKFDSRRSDCGKIEVTNLENKYLNCFLELKKNAGRVVWGKVRQMTLEAVWCQLKLFARESKLSGDFQSSFFE